MLSITIQLKVNFDILVYTCVCIETHIIRQCYRQGHLCRKCMRRQDAGTLTADEEDDDVSIIDSLVDESQRTSVLLQLQVCYMLFIRL